MLRIYDSRPKLGNLATPLSNGYCYLLNCIGLPAFIIYSCYKGRSKWGV